MTKNSKRREQIEFSHGVRDCPWFVRLKATMNNALALAWIFVGGQIVSNVHHVGVKRLIAVN